MRVSAACPYCHQTQSSVRSTEGLHADVSVYGCDACHREWREIVDRSRPVASASYAERRITRSSQRANR